MSRQPKTFIGALYRLGRAERALAERLIRMLRLREVVDCLRALLPDGE